jgi:hypothetical protein
MEMQGFVAPRRDVMHVEVHDRTGRFDDDSGFLKHLSSGGSGERWVVGLDMAAWEQPAFEPLVMHQQNLASIRT